MNGGVLSLCVCFSSPCACSNDTSQFIPSWAGPGEPPPGVALRLSGVVSPWRPRDLSGAARDPRTPLIWAKKNQTLHPPPSSPARHTPHARPTLPQTPTNKPHPKSPTRTRKPPPTSPLGVAQPKRAKKNAPRGNIPLHPISVSRIFGKLEISSNPSLLGVSATDAVKAKYDNPIVRRLRRIPTLTLTDSGIGGAQSSKLVCEFAHICTG